MARIKVLDFSAGGQHYEVFYDDVTYEIEAVTTPGPPASSATYAEMGVAENQILYWHCIDNFYLVRVIPQLAYPFATRYSEAFAIACMVLPCDLAITGVETVDESEGGAGDGEATILTATSYDQVQYSLDGFSWQLDNHFFGLLPGTYQVFVKDNRGCTAHTTFSIGAGAAVDDPPYPWADRVCRFFRLLTPNPIMGYDTLEVEEPGGWDRVNFVGKRDREWHGYRGMWSDGHVELEFDCAAGGDLLRARYSVSGSDTEVLFQYGYTKDGVDYVLFPGRINFNVYKAYDHKVVVGVEREDFDAVLKNRMDAKVSMAEDVGYDGAPLTPPLPADIFLHAKEIARATIISNTNVYSYVFDRILSGHDYVFLQPDTTAVTTNEVETFYSYPAGVALELPYEVEKYSLDVRFPGTYNIRIHWSGVFKPNAGVRVDMTMRHFYRLNNQEVQIGDTIHHTDIRADLEVPWAVDETLAGLDLQAGDKFYVYSHVQFSANPLAIPWVRQDSIDFTVESLENTGDSPAKGWLIGDVVDHTIRVITNGESRLRSTLLTLQGAQQATDGEASLNLLTNGKQIRRFDPINHPLHISLKDLLDSCKAHWCIGWGTETIGRTDVVRVERADYFYQDNQICVIEEVDHKSYHKECAKDMLYNELEFGYERFQDSGYNTLDEFNTRHEHVTPIQTNKLKLTAKSKFIASGYSIETSRREQYEDTPNDSVQNDEEPFIIAVKKGSGFFTTERAESFQVVNNLISPDTAYNLRHSPFRMLLNWAVWLRNCFHYKLFTDVVRTTFVAQNGALETQFEVTETRPVGDINRLLWREDQDVALQDLAVKRRIFRPDYIYARCRLTPDVVGDIHRAMRGGLSKEKNYGYIVVRNPEGGYDAGYLLEIEYNFYTEVAQLKLLERFEAVDPVEECCPYLVVNGCYVKINGLKTVL